MYQLSPREVKDLSGFWDFRLDSENQGIKDNWQADAKTNWNDCLYVPGNWNGQKIELEWYQGVGWYRHEFDVPVTWNDKAVWVHFAGAAYHSTVWVNEHYVGEYEGEFLPFDFRVEDFVRFGEKNKITVRVNNTLNEETIPAIDPGFIDDGAFNRGKTKGSQFEQYIDIFHYGGIYKPVTLICRDKTYIDDITIRTRMNGEIEIFSDVQNTACQSKALALEIVLLDEGKVVARERATINATAQEHTCHKMQMQIENPTLWEPHTPHLYTLEARIFDGDTLVDAQQERFGVREVAVVGVDILLNGKPVYLKGICSCESMPVLGRGITGAIMRRDADLLKKLNANFNRVSLTSEREENLELASELGLMTMEDIAWLHADYSNPVILQKMKRMMAEQIKRDKNNPAIIMWSILNEPLSYKDSYRPFCKEVIDLVRELDPTRPVTYVGCEFERGDFNYDLVDIICQNAYKGWYSFGGDIDGGMIALEKLMEEVHARFPDKPICLAEFGADAYPGVHSDPSELWTEEYQAELLDRTWRDVLLQKDYIAGGMIIDLYDYRSPQSFRRLTHQRKGLYTSLREPKMSAYTIRKLFSDIDSMKSTHSIKED